MTPDQTLRSFYEAASRHDIDRALSYFTEDGQFSDISGGRVFRGKNELRQMIDGWLKALPDMKLEVKNVYGTGNDWTVELNVVGTHKGAMDMPTGSIPASGARVNVPSADVIRLRNGKIQSLNCYFAATVFMNQIQPMPTSRAA